MFRVLKIDQAFAITTFFNAGILATGLQCLLFSFSQETGFTWDTESRRDILSSPRALPTKVDN